MKELEVLKDMIESTLDKRFKYTKNEFLNQLMQVSTAIVTKDKEIELKKKEIEQLNKNIKSLRDIMKEQQNKLNMCKSILKGIAKEL